MISARRIIPGSAVLLFCLWAHGAEETAPAPLQEPIPAEGGAVDGLPTADLQPPEEIDSALPPDPIPAEMEAAGSLPDADIQTEKDLSTGETSDAAGESPVTAAAGPFARDVVLVLDNSGSMKKSDPQFLTGQAVTGFIERLDDSARVAIIAFDQNVRILLPMTALAAESREHILESIRSIDYGGLFTDSPAAVERAIYELKNNARADAQKLIVFMTDGIVDTGDAAVDLEKAKWLREDLAPDAAEVGIRIFGIAFTDAADFQLIQSLAQNTDGEYFRALTPGDLPRVFERISEVIDRPPVVEPEPAPEPAVQPPPVPVIIEVPVQPAESVNAEERVRSIVILVAAVVLVGALVAIIILLIKRGREAQPSTGDYVAEAYLNDIHGITGQSAFKLGIKPTMLGRVAGQDTDHLDYVVIPQSTIGRRHALIEYKDFAYWIMDQGSINGTFVNDKPVSSEVRLKHGDRVRVHKCEFEFAMPDMGEAGMTVVSQTRFAGQAVPSGQEATVVKGGREPARDQESVFDITGGVGDAAPAVPEGEEATLIRAGSAESVNRDQPGPEDETLMPARSNPPGSAQQADSEDETLLPGGRPDDSADRESEDETILPLGAADPESHAGRPGRGKAEDDLSRVPGLGPRRK